MNHKRTKNIGGFTVIELLIVIGVIAVLAVSVLAYLSLSRAKAKDTRTKEELSSIRSNAYTEVATSLTGGDFNSVFSDSSTGQTRASINSIVSREGLSAGDYQVASTTTSFAIILPLKAETGYWCVDSLGNSKKVDGLLNATGPKNCNNTQTVNSGVITLIGSNPYGVTYSNTCANPSVYSSDYVEPGYTATDPQNGANITSQVSSGDIVITDEDFSSGGVNVSLGGGFLQYSVTDSSGKSYSVRRLLNLYRATASCGTVQTGPQPPTVYMNTPSDGATISADITVSATATDNTGIAGVTFKYGPSANTATSPIGPEVTTGSSGVYSQLWNISGISNGTYALVATARDIEGNIATSPAVVIHIQKGRKALLFSSGFEGTSATYLNGFDPTAQQYCCVYSLTQSTTIKHEGLAALKAEVRPNDPKVSNAWRAEVQPLGVTDAGDRWYGWSMYFDTPQSSGLFSGQYGGQYTHWNPNDFIGPSTLSISWDNNDWDFFTAPDMSHNDDHYGPTSSSPHIKITASTWHDVVVHANWASGQLEIWLDGTLFYSAQAGSGTLDENPGQYLKFGITKWGTGNAKPKDTWIIYYDNLRIGDGATGVKYYDVAPGNY